ncbi:hypothetical protein FRB99_001976 [Tulasnella sp. 403]|nr:hypothetical protein FRB99_001976 [Tulasnella sp. 403]
MSFPVEPTGTLFTVVCSVPVLFYVTKRLLRPRPLPGIPHHPITSPLGDFWSLAADTAEYGTPFDEGSFFWTSAEKLGPVFQVLMGPFTPAVVVADAQEMEDVLLRSRSKSLDICNVMLNMFSAPMPLGMTGIKTNEMWHRHRRVSTAVTSSTSLRKLAPSVVANARRLVKYWDEKMKQAASHGASCFCYEDDFEGATLDAITNAVTGRPCGVIGNLLDQLRHGSTKIDVDQYGGAVFQLKQHPLWTAFRFLFQQMQAVAFLPPWFSKIYQRLVTYTPCYRRHYKLAFEYVDTAIDEGRRAVREARAHKEEPNTDTMISWVVEKELESGEALLPGKEFRDEVMTYILIKYLTDAPEVQRELRAELLSGLDNCPDKRPLTFDDVLTERVPYLEAVVYEILRHAQVTELTCRTTLEPVNILGHTIPAGVEVLFLTMVSSMMSTNSRTSPIRAVDSLRSESSLTQGGGTPLWEESRTFKPERWLADDPDGNGRVFNPKAGYSMPFGVGPRSCAGRPLALMELKLYIATLNLAFFFDKLPAELGGHRPQARMTRGPVQVYVAPRPWDD